MVIMRTGGWKTRSVFERYNIFTQADVTDAVTKKLEKAEQEQAHEENARRALKPSQNVVGNDTVPKESEAIQ